MEFILLLPLFATLTGLVMTLGKPVRKRLTRLASVEAGSRFRALRGGRKPTDPQAAIAGRIGQAELDGGTSWFEERFHLQLLASGAMRIMSGEEPEEDVVRSSNGNVILRKSKPRPYRLDGCICKGCNTLLKLEVSTPKHKVLPWQEAARDRYEAIMERRWG